MLNLDESILYRWKYYFYFDTDNFIELRVFNFLSYIERMELQHIYRRVRKAADDEDICSYFAADRDSFKYFVFDSLKEMWGSKKQKRTRRQLRQYMNETIKEIIVGEKPRTIVVERLNKISKDTKKRVGKKTRRLIGNWNYRYWLGRIQQKCEENRIFFRSVLPYNTSIMCSNCGNVDKKQRNGLEFKCEQCGHIAQADINAAINILNRCLRGVYGPPSAEPEDKL